MSGTREEERRKLADIINHWNANRLDLFEISQPTEVGSCAAERAACPPGPSRGSDRGRRAGLWAAWSFPAGRLGSEGIHSELPNSARFLSGCCYTNIEAKEPRYEENLSIIAIFHR